MKAGLPALQIVGMGSKAIDEAKERVRSAVTNSLLDFPAKKFVINLAPAELPKDGSHYDLAIAIAILVSSGQVKGYEVDGSLFAGELSLDGNVRPIRGAISIAEVARDSGHPVLFVPAENIDQVELVEGVQMYPVTDLKQLFLHLKKEVLIPAHEPSGNNGTGTSHSDGPILDDVQDRKRQNAPSLSRRQDIIISCLQARLVPARR